jgi:hypothetical protein
VSARNGSGKTKNGASSKLAAKLSNAMGAEGSARNAASFAASRKNTVDNFPEPDATKKQKARKQGAEASEMHARMSERQSETNKRDKKRESKLERSDRKEKEKKDNNTEISSKHEKVSKLPKGNYVQPG